MQVYTDNLKTERVVYLDENNREVRYIRFKDVRNKWKCGSLNPLELEYLADFTNEMNTIGDKEDYPNVLAMIEPSRAVGSSDDISTSAPRGADASCVNKTKGENTWQ